MNTLIPGDLVVKNPDTWVSNELDWWGRGEGVGVIIPPSKPMASFVTGVRWQCGITLEAVSGLRKIGEMKSERN